MTADKHGSGDAAGKDARIGSVDQTDTGMGRDPDLVGAEAALRRAGQVARRRAAEVAKRNTPDPAVLDDIIRRVVKVAQPEKIVLFGSAARRAMTPNSDVDLLVIKDGRDPELSARIYEGLQGVRIAVDVIVVSPSDVDRYRDSHALVIKPALEHGRVVYEST